MNLTIKQTMRGIGNMMASGFYLGFVIGCLPNNKLFINYKGKKYNYEHLKVNLPLVSGFIGFITPVVSPLLIINYIFDGASFDNAIDKFNIDIKRYQQYKEQTDYNVYPSIIVINMERKN